MWRVARSASASSSCYRRPSHRQVVSLTAPSIGKYPQQFILRRAGSWSRGRRAEAAAAVGFHARREPLPRPWSSTSQWNDDSEGDRLQRVRECIDRQEKGKDPSELDAMLGALYGKKSSKQGGASLPRHQELEQHLRFLSQAWLEYQEAILEECHMALPDEDARAPLWRGTLRRLHEAAEAMEAWVMSNVDATPDGCLATLQAWERVARTQQDALHIHGAITHATAHRSIPQRAQLLLEQMERSSSLSSSSSLDASSDPTSSSSSSPPPVPLEAYHAVLQAWSHSLGVEHLFAVRAEALYQQLVAHGTLTPNHDTFRILLHTWAKCPVTSGMKRAPYEATGFLLQLQKYYLRSGKAKVALPTAKERHDNKNNDNEQLDKDDPETVPKKDTPETRTFLHEEEPTLEDYKAVFRAWSTSGILMAEKRSFGLLLKMESMHRQRQSVVRPDGECFEYVLQTIAQCPLPDLGKKADFLLSKMRNEYGLVPSSACFAAAIQTWRVGATHPRGTASRRAQAERAQTLLEQMKDMYHKSSTAIPVRPSTQQYNDVLQAWSVVPSHELQDDEVDNDDDFVLGDDGSNTPVERVWGLLREMQDGGGGGRRELELAIPNRESYQFVLETLAQSRLPDKLDRARQVLWDFMLQEQVLERGNAQALPNVDTYNAFLNVCSSALYNHSSQRELACREALELVQWMKKNSSKANDDDGGDETTQDGNDDAADEGNATKVSERQDDAFSTMRNVVPHQTAYPPPPPPNSATYHCLLQACFRLLPPAQAQGAIRRLFDQCCREGLVEEQVLSTFRSVASLELYEQSVLRHLQWVPNTVRTVLPTRKLANGVLAVDPQLEEAVMTQPGVDFGNVVVVVEEEKSVESQDLRLTMVLPFSWSRHVEKAQYVTWGNVTKTKPLSARSGRFLTLKEMKEYKMSTLRSRKNQMRLQGGRRWD